MKKNNTFLTLIIVTLLCISNVIPVFAVDENEKPELISIEEFSNAMTELYRKYNLNFELLDTSNYIPITRNIFKLELDKIEKDLVNVINTYNKNNEKISKIKENNKVLTNKEEFTPFIMPVTKIFNGSTQIKHSSGLAHVTIKYSAICVKDESNGQFISIDPGNWYNSSSLNLDDVVYNNKEWRKISGGKQILASANGIVKFRYTVLGATIKAEQPFTIFDVFE